VLVGLSSTVGDAVNVGNGVDVTTGLGVIVCVGVADDSTVEIGAGVVESGGTVRVTAGVAVVSVTEANALAAVPPPLPDKTHSTTATTTIPAKIAKQPARVASGC
jgi:hypothetical protein